MAKLRFNNRDVSISPLTQRPFRAAACELLLDVTPANRKTALAAFKKSGELGAYSGLRVSAAQDLSFLKDFPLLLYLEVHGDKVNTRHLDALTNLRGLRLESPGAGVDFACFPELEVFIGNWHRDNINIDRCHELRRLAIWHFQPRSGDISELANLVRLEQLSITQSSIASLAGLETLEDLRYFALAYVPQLTSLEVFKARGCGVRELSLSKAKGIQGYEPIAAIRQLRRLMLSGCAAMANLKWMEGMQDLDFFSFVDTNLIDGDLTPLLALPKLRYVGTLDKRHYSLRCNDLNARLQARPAT